MPSFSGLEVGADETVSSETFVMIKCANMCESLSTAFWIWFYFCDISFNWILIFNQVYPMFPTYKNQIEGSKKNLCMLFLNHESILKYSSSGSKTIHIILSGTKLLLGVDWEMYAALVTVPCWSICSIMGQSQVHTPGWRESSASWPSRVSSFVNIRRTVTNIGPDIHTRHNTSDKLSCLGFLLLLLFCWSFRI